jgi:hypothetical protein
MIHVPLIQSVLRREPVALGKRAAVGVAPLVDAVSVGTPDVDVSYLGLVTIGTPAQEFLLRIVSVEGEGLCCRS